MTFTVQQKTFEGPLDLLLQLIQQEELDITTISLAAVTEEYLARVAELQRENIPEISDFLVIAARLLLLKSRALLTEAVDDEEAGDDLAAQLAEYQMYKQLAAQLETSIGQASPLYGKPPAELASEVRFTGDGVSLQALQAVLSDALARLPEDKPLPEQALEEQLTIDECMDMVQTAVKEKSQPFAKLFASLKTRLAMIITFLAVLELIKQRVVAVRLESRQLMVAAR